MEGLYVYENPITQRDGELKIGETTNFMNRPKQFKTHFGNNHWYKALYVLKQCPDKNRKGIEAEVLNKTKKYYTGNWGKEYRKIQHAELHKIIIEILNNHPYEYECISEGPMLKINSGSNNKSLEESMEDLYKLHNNNEGLRNVVKKFEKTDSLQFLRNNKRLTWTSDILHSNAFSTKLKECNKNVNYIVINIMFDNNINIKPINFNEYLKNFDEYFKNIRTEDIFVIINNKNQTIYYCNPYEGVINLDNETQYEKNDREFRKQILLLIKSNNDYKDYKIHSEQNLLDRYYLNKPIIDNLDPLDEFHCCCYCLHQIINDKLNITDPLDMLHVLVKYV